MPTRVQQPAGGPKSPGLFCRYRSELVENQVGGPGVGEQPDLLVHPDEVLGALVGGQQRQRIPVERDRDDARVTELGRGEAGPGHPTDGWWQEIVGPGAAIDSPEVEALVAAGARPVRLGPGVLRSSTAGPAAIAVLSAASRWTAVPGR